MTDLDRENTIREHAEELAKTMPEKDRASFVEDYCDILGTLNERVDARIQDLREDLSPFLSGYGDPGMTENVIEKIKQLVTNSSNTLIKELAPFSSVAVRKLITDCLLDCLGATTDSVAEQQRRAEMRRGARAD